MQSSFNVQAIALIHLALVEAGLMAFDTNMFLMHATRRRS
jgi:hypothetical protein